MGKRKSLSETKPIPETSTSSTETTPKPREQRIKRKRYNSDDYILNDEDFLDTKQNDVSPLSTSLATKPLVPELKTFGTKVQLLNKKQQKRSPQFQKKQIQSQIISPSSKVKVIESPTVQQPTIFTTISLSTELNLQETPTFKNKKNEKKKKIKDGKKIKDKDSGTSSEEERWLDAIESGKLEDVDDELKKIKPKDPKFMTARQRAMYERSSEKETTNPITENLMSLPTGYKEKVLTAEAIKKAQIKSQKRKQLADEKREKDKRKTMERLLKKKDSKSVKQIKFRPVKIKMPTVSYRQKLDKSEIILPEGIEFPLKTSVIKNVPQPQLCSIVNCGNIKRYNCSKTNAPLCSFKCYKLNAMKVLQVHTM